MQSSAIQSYLRFPLTHLLGSPGHVRVLRALLTHGGPLSVSQIAADTGLSKRGARDVLESLVAQRVVGVLGPARGQLFAAALEHPLLLGLHQLFKLEQAHWDSLQSELRAGLARLKPVRSAWLYGSVAHGADLPRSDLDLALAVDEVALDTSLEIREAVQQLGEKLGVHISPVVLTPKDLVSQKLPPVWWSNVVRDAKVLKGFAPEKEAARAAEEMRTA